MLRGLYTSATGMILQQKRQLNVSQNLSNVNTPSFKKQEMMSKAIDSVMIRNKGNGSDLKTIGEIQLGVEIDGMHTDFEQGLLSESNRNLDFAIEGQGFFSIVKEDGGRAYTRDGNFKINSNGILVTQEGHAVLGKNLLTGSIEAIETGNQDIQLQGDGTLSLNGASKYNFNIVDFTDAQALDKNGRNMFSSENGTEVMALNYGIKQGYLEKSNVNPLEEMVKIIEITRNFESNQKVMQSIDETLGKAVNEVGRIG